MAGFCASPYKESFPSMGAARKVVRQMQRRSKRGKSHSLAQTPYRCNCGEFHLAYPKRVKAYEDEQHRQRQSVVSW